MWNNIWLYCEKIFANVLNIYRPTKEVNAWHTSLFSNPSISLQPDVGKFWLFKNINYVKLNSLSLKY